MSVEPRQYRIREVEDTFPSRVKCWQWPTVCFFGISRYCCHYFRFIHPKGRPFCSRNLEILILFVKKIVAALCRFSGFKIVRQLRNCHGSYKNCRGNYEIVTAVTKIVSETYSFTTYPG